jgi:hypothetical protein
VGKKRIGLIEGFFLSAQKDKHQGIVRKKEHCYEQAMFFLSDYALVPL